jgi:CheY-like chemotaxis protein
MLPTQVRHKLILVVEDNFVLSETLSALLGADGYRVWTAADGQEALERLRGKEKPGLLVLDLMLPVKDGFAVLKERQDDTDLASIPVLVLSGAADVREQVLSLGATEYLAKPVDATTLLKAVHRHCC